MSSLPEIAIVGRPNVGKSSLFNRIIGKRIAVVDDMAGVTRDRNTYQGSWQNQSFALTDTGGLLPTDPDDFSALIGQQVAKALAKCSAVIFLVDISAGPTDHDLLIARYLHKEFAGPVYLALNKAESDKTWSNQFEFLTLGFGEGVKISALHGFGIGNLLQQVCEKLPENGIDAEKRPNLSLAIVGRPNAGKSSFINQILKDERLIVSKLAGTTRDSIDIDIVYNNQTITLIDTAGLRKKGSVKDSVEYYSNLRSLQAIKQCTICVLLIDSLLGISEQDLKIIEQAQKSYKGLIISLNKWDLIEKETGTFEKMTKEIQNRYRQLRSVPIVAISALTGQRTYKILDTAYDLWQRMHISISQTQITKAILRFNETKPHPPVHGENVKLHGARQVEDSVPHFHIFTSGRKNMLESYKRYIENSLRSNYDLAGCPLIIEYRNPGGRRSDS